VEQPFHQTLFHPTFKLYQAPLAAAENRVGRKSGFIAPSAGCQPGCRSCGQSKPQTAIPPELRLKDAGKTPE